MPRDKRVYTKAVAVRPENYDFLVKLLKKREFPATTLAGTLDAVIEAFKQKKLL